MFRRGLVSILAMVLIIGGLLALGGYAGWSQGYTAGLVAGSEGAIQGYAPHWGGYAAPWFFGIGFFFKLLFLFLFFFIIFKIFRFFSWRMSGGPRGDWGGPGRGHHGYWHHHDMPEGFSEGRSDKDDNDSDSGDAPVTRV